MREKTALRQSAAPLAVSGAPRMRLLTSDIAARLTFYLAALTLWLLIGPFFERVPGPIEIIAAIVEEFNRGEVVSNFLVTFYRLSIGVGMATVIGTLLGIVMGYSQFSRAFFEGQVLVGLSIPAIIWAFLTAMWFGFGNVAPILTTFLTAVPFVIINVSQGVRGVSRDLRDMSASYGVPTSRQIRELILPAVAGYVFTGIRFAVIMGWNGVLLAEWFGGSGGVGYRARYWYDANQYPGFAAWVVLFIGSIVILDRLVFDRATQRAFRWRDNVA